MKDSIKKVKIHLEKMFVNHISNKGLLSRVYKEYLIVSNIKTSNSKWIKDINVSTKAPKFSEETIGINLHDFELGNKYLI